MSIFSRFQHSDQRRSFYSFLTLAIFSFLSACGGSSQFNERTYAIGGYVSGLNAGQQVILVNNASDTLAVAADGSFLFDKTVAFNGSYNITVGTQPTGQVCSVANNTGSGAGVTANVTSVSIVCATTTANTYTIGGSVSGLSNGQQVTLQNNGADALTVTSNSSFVFSQPVALNGSYSVTVGTQPTGQVCSVANNSGSGAGVTANVTSVSIVCANAPASTYTISGSITGLPNGLQVTLNNNSTDPLTVLGSGNGSAAVSFTFSTSVASGASYAVTVGTQPKGFKWCSVTANPSSGSVTSNVTNVAVSCVESAARASTLVSTATDNPAPTGVAVDTQGNVYVAQWRDDSDPNMAVIVSTAWDTVSKITTGNQQATFASNLSAPVGLTFDASGNLYIVQTDSTEIKKVTSAGVVSTFVDINAIDPNMGVPAGIYFDSQNSEFFVTDFNGRVSVITSAGALVRSISLPGGSAMGVVVDASGNIYVSDYLNSTILKVDTSNNVTTFAGSSQGFADGTTVNAKFSGPYGITKDTSGNLYVADQGNNKIRKITAAGVVTTLTPTLSSGAAATFNAPTGITTDANGVLYVTEYYGRKVSKISPISP
jgi:sugar lactone lactonase YvrE